MNEKAWQKSITQSMIETTKNTGYQQPAEVLATYKGRGTTSGKYVSVKLYQGEPGRWIVFILPDADNPGEKLFLPATADNVVNTLRNVVIGKGKTRLCIVEHLLCAASLCAVEDAFIEIDGPEVPLGNGSGDLWFEFFRSAGFTQRLPQATIDLKEPIVVNRKDRLLMAVPDQSFSATYLMDWPHPKIGRTWRSWTPDMGAEEIINARTFGPLMEHKMLGLDKEMVSLTEDDFTMPLRFPDEPVRHKLLDLIGDLMLCGINPLKIKARFISIKGGHEIDVEMAGKLKEALA